MLVLELLGNLIVTLYRPVHQNIKKIINYKQNHTHINFWLLFLHFYKLKLSFKILATVFMTKTCCSPTISKSGVFISMTYLDIKMLKNLSCSLCVRCYLMSFIQLHFSLVLNWRFSDTVLTNNFTLNCFSPQICS